jgi:hypothetical protein
VNSRAGLSVSLLLIWAGCQNVTVVVGDFEPSAAGRGAAGESNDVDASTANAAGRGPMDSMNSSGAGNAPALTDPTDARPPVPNTPDPPDIVTIDSTPRESFCIGTGIPLRTRRPSSSPADCGADLARKLFSYALCSCGDLGLPNASVLVDSFDSNRESYQPGQSAAPVGVNGSITQLAADTRLSGSVFVAGLTPIQILDSRFSVGGDFKTNAALDVSTAGPRIARDLWIGGDIRGPKGSIAVGRDAHQAIGRTGADVLAVMGRSFVSNAVNVRPPCACEDNELLDIPGLVTQAEKENDNAAAAWMPNALHIPQWVTDYTALPCGRLFVDELTIEAPSTYTILFSSRTALFVRGDLTVRAPSTLVIAQLGLTGELDIFVAGNVTLESTLSLGGNTKPSAVRLYVGGQITVRDRAPFGLNANLYAPHATIDFPASLDSTQAYGSIFARSIKQVGYQQLHYDRAVQQVGPDCAAKLPQRCDACYQCANNLACVAGSCVPCASDADCCGASVCTNGRCDALQP